MPPLDRSMRGAHPLRPDWTRRYLIPADVTLLPGANGGAGLASGARSRCLSDILSWDIIG
jgi:hypothetical protein